MSETFWGKCDFLGPYKRQKAETYCQHFHQIGA